MAAVPALVVVLLLGKMLPVIDFVTIDVTECAKAAIAAAVATTEQPGPVLKLEQPKLILVPMPTKLLMLPNPTTIAFTIFVATATVGISEQSVSP